MYLRKLLGSLAAAAALTQLVAADLRITADNHSFGGVNFPQLQFLQPAYREEVIRAIVKSGARVIRLFVQGDENHSDPEPTLGEFDKRMLDVVDDTMAAIWRISKGQVKVIIAPHNAHALRGTDEIPCDAYCKDLDGAFLDFYSEDKYRNYYKQRLEVMFNHYPSRNFGQKPWSKLNGVILGVDLQNEPWAGISPIPAGEGWICDIANHLKRSLGLGESSIAVITGGIGGAQTVDGNQNFPDAALQCQSVDVIGIHGYFRQKDEETAGTPWAKMFLPGNTLVAAAKKKHRKLLLVEEWSYGNTALGLNYKKQAIFDQGNALNYRGIPWLYSRATWMDEGTTDKVNVLRDQPFAIGALSDALLRAARSRSDFDWSSFIPRPDGGLTNQTLATLNQHVNTMGDCTFGCEGFLCDAADGCAPDLMCKNSICQVPDESQPGKIDDACNSRKPCLAHLSCEDGTCQKCLARPTIPPRDHRKKVLYADPNLGFGRCPVDSDEPFVMRPYCSLPPPPSSPNHRSNPCLSARHCDANEFCDWGFCKRCTEGCLGMKCKSNQKCKTGFCNRWGTCDYPPKKQVFSQAAHDRSTSRDRRPPPGIKMNPAGGNRIVDHGVRIQVPKDEVKATGQATRPTATAGATA